MGISSPPSPPLLSRSAFAASTPSTFLLISSFPFKARGKKLNSSACLHLVLPSAAQIRIWIWRWETRRGRQCGAQLTPSHSESSERAAGFGQEWEALPDLSFFANLCSSSKSCFPNLQMFSNLALWVKTPHPPSRVERECLCMQTFRVSKKGAGTRLSKSRRQGRATTF